ncbi:SEFIR domain-containing protein [uncultured Sphingobium sp.]|uniref:SEFIR domain-containing protein n=1 Tax=uncultured Sphingobium sp. TaxID=316087 RepID=UPI0032B280CA
MSAEDVEQADRKAFISYSWSSPEHKTWVRGLANRLMEDGVYVILDDWDLKPGHDPIHFMEQSITDPQVTKVLIVCDRVYKEKADGRAGGVGTETQILTPEIYRKADQNKYAALVTEVDDAGDAYVPTFYGNRIFIDFSKPENEEVAYEELTRWINDAPLHQRPKLGKKPAYILSQEEPLATESRFRRAREALERGAQGASGLMRDFGEGLFEQLIALRPVDNAQGTMTDEEVVAAADAMRPYIRQLHELTRAMARGAPLVVDELTSVLEQVLSTVQPSPDTSTWRSTTYDANKMMAYEGFLGVAAILVGERQLDLLARVLDHAYYFDDRYSGRGRSTKDFEEFNQFAESLEGRNRRTGNNRSDWQADFIFEQYQKGAPSFARMMEADLLLHVKRQLGEPGRYTSWIPHTLVYSGRSGGALELFARMESAQYFAKVSGQLFGGIDVDTYKQRAMQLGTERFWPRAFPSPSIGSLIGLSEVATRP